MQYRTQRGLVWMTVHILGCLLGLLILGYAIYLWSGSGFTLGPNQRLHPGVPDPSGGERYLFLLGITLSAYLTFALYSALGPANSSDSDTDRDTTSSI